MIYYTSDLEKIEFTPIKEAIGSVKQGRVYDFSSDKYIKVYEQEAIKYTP